MRRLAPLAAVLAAACSPLSALNSADRLMAPRGVRQVARAVAYGSDPRQRLDIYAPAYATHAPVLVFFYGGSWASGRRQDYGFVGRAFASRGFVTVVPDYRLVPAAAYPAFVQDGAAAVAWTVGNIARYGGDPARLGLAGHSAGAYIAVTLALDRRWLAAAGVLPGAVRAVAGLSGPYDFYPFDVPASVAAFAGAADGPATQPINHVAPGAPPMLLAHGEADTTVRPRNSLRLGEALTVAGDRATVRLYPKANHVDVLLGLSQPFRRRVPALDDSAAFLAQALR